MKRIFDYFRGLIADANHATDRPARHRQSPVPAVVRGLDHPTYLRRGLVIAGLSAGRMPGEPLHRSAGQH